ncbi:MAG: hypothetical protein LUE89_00090 [Clostridiales bacterium]|nr:hypothetical protein [Clostridiales bacterium]
MNKKTILWVSRHAMTPDQLADMARIMRVTTDNLDIIQHGDTVRDVAELTHYLHKVAAACVVLPHQMLADFWARANTVGITVYVAENLRNRDESGNFVFKHAGWYEVQECTYRRRRA